MLTIEAATPASGRALCEALSTFQPELETDEEGRCFVSVLLGDDGHAREVFDAILQFTVDRGETPASSVISVVGESPIRTAKGISGRGEDDRNP